MKTFTEIIDNLNQKPIMPNYIPSLDKMSAALSEFAPVLEEYKSQMIVIAGTNGKGSTAKALESLLISSGKRVCLYTSPHLVKINERFRKNGCNISDEDFTLHYNLTESISLRHKLTHFEILTLIAVSYFMAEIKNSATCIWEVGMGGRWDATNAIPHIYNVITTIGQDHQKYLGSSLEEIAANKFDIIQHGSVTVSGFLPTATYPLLRNKVATNQSTWFDLSTDVAFQTKYSFERGSGLKDCIQHNHENFSLGLVGERGYQNTLLALYTLKALKIEIEKKHLVSLSTILWPHRFSLLKNALANCPVYLSGDHNPEGMQSLLNIVERLNYKKIWIVAGITEGRDPNSLFDPLASITNSELILTESPFKGLKIADYQKDWKQYSTLNPKSFSALCDAFSYVCKQATTEDIILVTGSLYLTGKTEELFGLQEHSVL